MKRTTLLAWGILIAASAWCVCAAQPRNAIRTGSDLAVEKGQTVHDAVVIGGNLVVNGTVEHDAVAVGGSVTLNEGASVGHNAVAVGGRIVEGPGAHVAGDTVEVGMSPYGFTRDIQAFFLVLGLLSLVSFLVLAVLVAAIFPSQVEAVALVIEKETAQAALWGFVGILLIVPVALLLAVTVIGIMLIPLELVLVAAALLVGYISAAAFTGRKVVTALKRSGWTLVGETLLGTVLLALAGFIPLIGWLVTTAALVLGFGAVLYALLRRRPEKTGVITA